MTNQNNDKSKNGKRIALILVALLLIAAIAFGAYTYSKYVSSREGQDSATVAAWGYTVTVGNGTDNSFGFSQYYGADGEADADGTNAVIAGITSDKNVVAPGAHGSTTITISGYAEVDAELSVVVADSFSDIYIEMTASGQTPATLYYFPVLFSLESDDDQFTDITNQPLANVVAALEDLSAELPSSNSTTGTTTTYTLSWAWAFEGTADSAGAAQNTLWTKSGDTYSAHSTKITAADVDKLDTSLGQAVTSVDLSNDSITVGEQSYTYNKDDCHTSLDLQITVSITQTGITG